MKPQYIEEPKLEFGTGYHVCPRAGIAKFSVYDLKTTPRRTEILVGAIGTSETLDKLNDWFIICSQHISAKSNTNNPNLDTEFCGFNLKTGFKAKLNLDDTNSRKLKNSEIKKITQIENWNERVEKAVDLYYRHVKFLAQNRNIDIVVCTIPSNLYSYIARDKTKIEEEKLSEEDSSQESILETDFRRALKAKTMSLGKPLQLVKESTLESNKKQQDNATKAWNFCTALYFKANNTVPWKLTSNHNNPSMCFVGISFYRSRDRKVLNTSLAQIFDELGNSVILRGTPVDIDKKDRKPYLNYEQAYNLLKQALYEYEIALSNSPARLVIHKSSKYHIEELNGFREAAEELRISSIDFVTLLDTNFKLFRNGDYPPYRGTHIEIDRETHLLYTKGSVKYYQTYPGKYIPQPIEIRIVESDESPNVICNEILGLTKMNWNNTQFDGKFPITLKCARNVGQIMKYLRKNEQPQIGYKFYM